MWHPWGKKDEAGTTAKVIIWLPVGGNAIAGVQKQDLFQQFRNNESPAEEFNLGCC